MTSPFANPSSSTSTPTSTPAHASALAMHATSQKDYSAALGALQSQYGFGGCYRPPHIHPASVPLAPASASSKDSASTSTSNSRKWYERGSSPSSSTASLLNTHASKASAPSVPSVPSGGSHRQGNRGASATESEMRLGALMAEYGYGSVSRTPHPRG